MSFQTAFVIDNGSGVCKAGLNNENIPKYVFPTVFAENEKNSSNSEIYYGNDAYNQRSDLKLNYPIQNGRIENWEAMTGIWQHLYKKDTAENYHKHPVILTEPPFSSKSNKEMMAQIMFEKFDVPATYAANPGVLALYAVGKVTGIVVDLGETVSHIVPIYQGFTISNAIEKITLAGRHLNEYLIELLYDLGYNFGETSAKFETVRDIKEKLCYVDLKFYEEKLPNDTTYTLPDGQVINILGERSRCPEALFNPKLIQKETDGIHELLHRSINKTDMDIRKVLYKNITLVGGTSMFPRMVNRLEWEMTQLAPVTTEIKINVPPDRQNSAWIGGAILSSLSSFQNMWISKKEYSEIGANIVHKK